MNAIEISHLAKTYRGKKRTQVEALKDFSLEIVPGEVFGFLGPNGAGKSTTIKILTGQIRCTSGSAFIFGKSVTLAEARRKVGYLPENPSFYDFMTAREYLRFVGHVFGMGDAHLKRSTDEVLERMDLQHAANRPLRGYSKGMIQRLGLAQALLPDPDLLIFDEPMSGLDPLGRALVKEIIRDLKSKGKTVFFSTHITTDVEIVCDRVGILVAGQLRCLDNVDSILAAGIEGYRMRVVSPSGHSRLVDVDCVALRSRMEEVLSTGETIDLIEPKRTNLEEFFLNIVGEVEDAHR